MSDGIFAMAIASDKARDKETIQTRERIAELEAEVGRLRVSVKFQGRRIDKLVALADRLAEALSDVLNIWMNPTLTRTIESTNATAQRGSAALADYDAMKAKPEGEVQGAQGTATGQSASSATAAESWMPPNGVQLTWAELQQDEHERRRHG